MVLLQEMVFAKAKGLISQTEGAYRPIKPRYQVSIKAAKYPEGRCCLLPPELFVGSTFLYTSIKYHGSGSNKLSYFELVKKDQLFNT